MATQQQTQANQQNARRSTGPRTTAGKAKSSQNAIKHGLRAQATVLPDEDPENFEFLIGELQDQFQPQTALEWNLLRQLADAEWRMRRVPGLEASLFAANLHETIRYYSDYPERLPEDDDEADMVLIGVAAASDAKGGDTFSKLSRYEARLSHRYFKALEHLQKLQGLRSQTAKPEKHQPADPGPKGKAAPRGAGSGNGKASGEGTVPARPAASCASSRQQANSEKASREKDSRKEASQKQHRCEQDQRPLSAPQQRSESSSPAANPRPLENPKKQKVNKRTQFTPVFSTHRCSARGTGERARHVAPLRGRGARSEGDSHPSRSPAQRRESH